jgi:hypothetical protein
MFKTLGMICIAVACAGASGQPSSNDQHAPLLQGQPDDRQAHAKAPTDAQAIAACTVREQADHTGMSKSEAEAACRERLAAGATHRTASKPRK